jgi:hypothetical protein
MDKNDQFEPHEAARYAEHSGGWTLMEVRGDSPVVPNDKAMVELIFCRYERPCFIFRVKFLVEDEFVEKCVYESRWVDMKATDRRFYWINGATDETCEFYELLTSKVGPELVRLSDRLRSRRRRPHYLEDDPE